jgi:signal transduction histidine kinase
VSIHSINFHVPGDPAMRRIAAAVLAFWVSGTDPLKATIEITRVVADGRELTLSAASGKSAAKPATLKSSARELRLHFGNSGPLTRASPRLRYKLEGHDADWRDLPVRARLFLRFFDQAGQVIGSETFPLTGETPGWTGAVESSPLVARVERLEVPERAVRALVSFLTDAEDVGVAGIDGLRVTVQPMGGGPDQAHDLRITDGSDIVAPLGTPWNWMREGSRAELAQLRNLPASAPHPALVILDDDATRYGNWALRPERSIPVRPRDHLRLEWKAAHSLGACGPAELRYERLKPGSYWFRVAAAGANGEFTGEEFTLPVVVLAPLYQRPLFWLLLLSAAGVILALASWYLTRRRLQRRLESLEREQTLERERARIAGDLHDEIGAGLTEIAMQSDWIRREVTDLAPPQATLKRLDSLCGSAVHLTRSVDEIVWALNPANDTLERFVNYLTQSAENFLDASGVAVRFEIPTGLPAVVVPGKTRHLLFLAALEAMHNAVKHANANVVRLRLRVTGHHLHLAIEDNGCGFVPDDAVADGTHEGLANMNRRMREIGGVFLLTSRPGEGTRAEFDLKLTEETTPVKSR